MKQNEILMIAGVGVLGLAAFTMMNRNNQPQQPIIIPYPQPHQPAPAGTNTGGGSAAPKQSTVDKAQKWVDTAGNVADIFKNIFNGTQNPNIRPLI